MSDALLILTALLSGMMNPELRKYRWQYLIGGAIAVLGVGTSVMLFSGADLFEPIAEIFEL
ncbi:hypothetical protein [Acinetobacter sp.]|uniref:hypothetical protein n=1 Tax=Acinetobacter sp. TaxID=472 RepID=UPI0035B2B744